MRQQHINTVAFQQGQRDREQGWPPLNHYWGFTGWAVYAYDQGYEHPRVKEASYV